MLVILCQQEWLVSLMFPVCKNLPYWWSDDSFSPLLSSPLLSSPLFSSPLLSSPLLFSDYLLSNNHVNSIIVHKFDFSDEEIMAYYISFLKTLSLKLNNHTVHFFYNEVRTQEGGVREVWGKKEGWENGERQQLLLSTLYDSWRGRKGETLGCSIDERWIMKGVWDERVKSDWERVMTTWYFIVDILLWSENSCM